MKQEKYSFPPDDGLPLAPDWEAPLDAVARAIAHDERFRLFALEDFMIMCRVNRQTRPRLTLYKHTYTRRYLNLDDAGHAYRYFAPRSEAKREGQYRPYRSLTPALEALGLWELPWMKPGLEEHQRGYCWDERWPSRSPEPTEDDWWCDDRCNAHVTGEPASPHAGRRHLWLV